MANHLTKGYLIGLNYHNILQIPRFLLHSVFFSFSLSFLNVADDAPNDRPPPTLPINAHPPINRYITCSFASELPPKVEGIGSGFGEWMVLLHVKVNAGMRLGE